MGEVRLRTVDSFADGLFRGNPAGVVMLDEAPSDEWMATVAREAKLSDTAFVIRERLPNADFRLRWFTQGPVEDDLCGHATLAAAHCLFEDGVSSPIRFATRSGVLTVSRREDGSLAMDFPAWPPSEVDPPADIAGALGAPVEWLGRSGNDHLLALVADERAVRDLRPDIERISRIPADVIIVTAAADRERGFDFVSRVFAPNLGINEDPVTGSAHTVLAPFWADRLGRTALAGVQASARSGLVGVELIGDRVIVSGRAVTILDGVLRAPEDGGFASDRAGVVVDARPEPLAIDPWTTAVIVVDMQNDFGADGGMFARAGIPIADITTVVEPIANVLRAARRVGMTVIYLTMQFEPDLSNAGTPDSPNFLKHKALGVGDVVVTPGGRRSRTLVKGTWGTEILSELSPEEGDIVVAKHRFSGFFETELDAILRRRGIESLVFTGCTTSVCVDSTLRDAFYRDYRCLLLSDCTGEPIGSDLARSNHEASLLVIETLFGWVCDSPSLLAALRAAPARDTAGAPH
jgi:ureidoacrylate peracid hydrolase